jgi:hypothetical protein
MVLRRPSCNADAEIATPLRLRQQVPGPVFGAVKPRAAHQSVAALVGDLRSLWQDVGGMSASVIRVGYAARL